VIILIPRCVIGHGKLDSSRFTKNVLQNIFALSIPKRLLATFVRMMRDENDLPNFSFFLKHPFPSHFTLVLVKGELLALHLGGGVFDPATCWPFARTSAANARFAKPAGVEAKSCQMTLDISTIPAQAIGT
jgi:hypothetical protein